MDVHRMKRYEKKIVTKYVACTVMDISLHRYLNTIANR